jgi:hypothetical protein
MSSMTRVTFFLNRIFVCENSLFGMYQLEIVLYEDLQICMLNMLDPRNNFKFLKMLFYFCNCSIVLNIFQFCSALLIDICHFHFMMEFLLVIAFFATRSYKT